MRHTLFFALLLLASELSANVAQPGIWQAGGAGAFTLLFPEDIVAFRQVQMVEERIYIQLHQGFAVVRGDYWLHNTSDEELSFKMGYPLNGIIDRSPSSYRNEIVLDSLHAFQVLLADQLIETSLVGENSTVYHSPSKWYAWPIEFAPDQTLKLQVYFLVNTNQASILSGYDRDEYNAFIYLVESGISWQPPIGKGQIVIQTADGLSLKDIHGLEYTERFIADQQQQLLIWQFEQLTPSSDDNVLLTYGHRNDNFDFPSVVRHAENYFDAVQGLAKITWHEQSGDSVSYRSVYEVDTRAASRTIGFVFFALFYGPWILLAIGLFFVGRFLWRKFRRSQLEN